MKTKEQKIEDIFLEGNLAKVTKRKETKNKKKRLKEELKKEKWWYNQWNKTALSFVSGCMKWQIKQTIVKLEQQLKELGND